MREWQAVVKVRQADYAIIDTDPAKNCAHMTVRVSYLAFEGSRLRVEPRNPCRNRQEGESCALLFISRSGLLHIFIGDRNLGRGRFQRHGECSE